MAFDFSTLIIDRSRGDLDALRNLLATPMEDWTADQLAAFSRAKDRGAYNYTDLNRVTACMDYLNGRLTDCGYTTGYKPVEEFHEDDVPTASTMAAYLANVESLKTTLTLPEDTPKTPGNMEGLTLTEANNIEQILEAINDYLTAMQAVFLHSGMVWAISGGSGYYFEN